MLSDTLSVTYNTHPPLGRVLFWLDEALIASLLVTFAVMVGVVSSQVFLRYALNTSLDWADELGRLMFVWTIFLAIPLGVRQGGHIGIDIIIDKFPASVREGVKRGGSVVAALMMGAIAWAALGVAREQWDELMATLDVSVGWFIVPIMIGALVSALHLVRIAIEGAPVAAVGGAE